MFVIRMTWSISNDSDKFLKQCEREAFLKFNGCFSTEYAHLKSTYMYVSKNCCNFTQMHPNLLNDAPKKDMLDPNKFRNCELKMWADRIKIFFYWCLFYGTPCSTIRQTKDDLPALCPFACYYKCDFIDYDVTISPETKHYFPKLEETAL